jgi:hypothetical protein
MLFNFNNNRGDMNKIDLIIENIEYAKLVKEQAHKDELLEEALAAARELRELKPVAWAAPSIWGGLEGLSFDKQPRFDTPLYALEVTK